MEYRKFKANGIFNGYQLLTGHTLVTSADGTIEEIIPSLENEDNVEKLEGILCPGFVNAHCHLELSHMKGRIPQKTGLVDFVYKVITERFGEKDAGTFVETLDLGPSGGAGDKTTDASKWTAYHAILDAIAAAENEMITNGIVAVGDICNGPMTIYQKQHQNIRYHNFIEVSGFMPSIVPARFQKSVALFNFFGKFYWQPIESNSLAPHAPYSVAKELMQKIASFPGNHILTMHNQETDDENKLYQNKTGDFLRLYEKLNIDVGFFSPPGTTSLQAFLPYFSPGQRLILVHNVCTSREDLDFISKHEGPALYFCLCPKANLYITGMLPPVELLIQSKHAIVLGTDSLASNDTLSLLDEINTLKKHFPHLDYYQMLTWATINGATALGIEEKYGSFEKGKMPGIILIDNAFEKVRRIL